MLDRQKIFVSGSTGLVGTSIIKYLLTRYPSLRIRGTYHTSLPFYYDERIEYIRADLTNREDCQIAVEGCTSAILAAAITGGAQMANDQPYRQMTDNLVMDALSLEAIYRAGIQRTIYLSSATVYQPFNGYIKEEDLDWNQDPHSAYLGVGWAKRTAEKLCQFWHDRYKLEIVILRCANIYGPFARFDPSASNFIPALIRKAVDKVDPFEVWGAVDVARDVIFADDVAQVVGLCLARKDITFDVFNLGFGKSITVGNVVDFVLKHTRHDPKRVLFRGAMPTTIGFRALDCNKIKSRFDWEPSYSVEDGIGITVDWWSKNKELWKK